MPFLLILTKPVFWRKFAYFLLWVVVIDHIDSKRLEGDYLMMAASLFLLVLTTVLGFRSDGARYIRNVEH